MKGCCIITTELEQLDESLNDREKLKKLREIKHALIENVRAEEKKRSELRTLRDQDNQKVKELFTEARHHRTQRDLVNEDVKLNKALRDVRQEDADKVLEELEKLEETMKDSGIKRPQGKSRHSRIATKIRELEMKIQTTARPTAAEETEMINEIERLYKQMEELEVAEEKQDEMRAIQKRLRTLRSEALGHHREVQKLAGQSQEHHEIMLGKISEAKKIRTAADENHQIVITLSDEIRKIRKQIHKVASEGDRIRKQLGQETAVERKKRRAVEAKTRDEEITKTAGDILERYQRGEKLGFEEFKLLISRGLLND